MSFNRHIGKRKTIKDGIGLIQLKRQQLKVGFNTERCAIVIEWLHGGAAYLLRGYSEVRIERVQGYMIHAP